MLSGRVLDVYEKYTGKLEEAGIWGELIDYCIGHIVWADGNYQDSCIQESLKMDFELDEDPDWRSPEEQKIIYDISKESLIALLEIPEEERR